APAGLELRGLVVWGETPAVFPFRRHRPVGIILVLLTVSSLIGFLTLTTGVIPFVIAVVLQSVFAATMYKRVRGVLLPVEKRARELALFAGLLARFEAERFNSPLLQNLGEALETDGRPP